MTTKQVHVQTCQFYNEMAQYLNTIPDRLLVMDIQAALAAACAEIMGEPGGVLLVWWDREHGVRLNGGGYPEQGSGGAGVKRDEAL